MAVKKYKSILVISDTHFPYHHPDTIGFLKKIKQDFGPDKVVHIGDEIDGHAISFHKSDPDLLSPGDELKQAKIMLKPLYDLFPKVDVMESNHGSLVYRRAHDAGLPMEVIKPYRKVIEAPKGWRWHEDLILHTEKGPVYFCHGKTARPLELSKSEGMHSVQGHFHQQFAINSFATKNRHVWQMFVGCLINKRSLAFAYGRNSAKQPVIGCGIIINGFPRLLKMDLNRGGRWTGKIV